MKTKDEKIENLIEQLKANPDSSELKKQLAEAKKQLQNTYEMMPESQK